ncbi:uncharacterized protein LOC106436937 [Brassica napus]|uniref:uncharacterized protein LOC106436937 n=1 Tax=Brassica napus TaxID=3708 RepID=UPI0020798AAA|nr:uncharacterized protein LOC106436937 [Brassica napus]
MAQTVTSGSIIGWRSRRYQELSNSILAIDAPQPESGRDVMLWGHGVDDYRDTFSSSKIWDRLRLKRNKVGWYRVVWFLQGVPRYSFITWLAIKNRLSTGDRMRQWGMIQGCELCGKRDETRDHLYFACLYSYTIWKAPARILVGSGVNPDWQWTLQRLQAMGTKGVDSCIV